MMQVAIAAGLICGVIVFAYFIAIDQYRAAAANGGHVAGAVRQPFLKQLESLMRPVSSPMSIIWVTIGGNSLLASSGASVSW